GEAVFQQVGRELVDELPVGAKDPVDIVRESAGGLAEVHQVCIAGGGHRHLLTVGYRPELVVLETPDRLMRILPIAAFDRITGGFGKREIDIDRARR
ncbi:MAG: hypothetical protein KY432_10945, partial [Acidobacteria bacterium]|nr:hypothetical protein [Acidobacteriota bacterium]